MISIEGCSDIGCSDTGCDSTVMESGAARDIATREELAMPTGLEMGMNRLLGLALSVREIGNMGSSENVHHRVLGGC